MDRAVSISPLTVVRYGLGVLIIPSDVGTLERQVCVCVCVRALSKFTKCDSPDPEQPISQAEDCS